LAAGKRELDRRLPGVCPLQLVVAASRLPGVCPLQLVVAAMELSDPGARGNSDRINQRD